MKVSRVFVWLGLCSWIPTLWAKGLNVLCVEVKNEM